MVVMRNGKEIGRSIVDLGGQHSATKLATLIVDGTGQFHWSVIPLPGHEGDGGHALDATLLERMRLPEEFERRLKPVLSAGMHVLVTPAPIRAETTGVPITVAAAKQ